MYYFSLRQRQLFRKHVNIFKHQHFNFNGVLNMNFLMNKSKHRTNVLHSNQIQVTGVAILVGTPFFCTNQTTVVQQFC